MGIRGPNPDSGGQEWFVTMHDDLATASVWFEDFDAGCVVESGPATIERM